MRHSLPLLVLAALTLGCSAHPLAVQTQDALTVHGSLTTDGRIITETPPVSDGGPVRAMPIDACPTDKEEPRIAVIDVDGLLLNTPFTGPYSLGEDPVALFQERLQAAAADPRVRAVVVRINSPGGGVTATDIVWHELREFRSRTGRPVVACLLDVGAGGAYYLATAADAIVANPTSVTGGIGVILNLYNLRDLMAQYNVFSQEVKSGKNVDMGTPIHNLSPEARELFQSMADEFHNRFKEVVRAARPKLDTADATLFDGRVFTARQALDRGLIDRIGYLEDAVALAGTLAEAPGARMVLFHRANDPARSAYAVTPNVPLQSIGLPFSLPGLDRSRLPTFLYLWQPEVGLERLSGK